MPITLDGTNGITTPSYGGADAAEYLVPVTGFKNRIINGACAIDQRRAGASGTGSTGVVDRFMLIENTTGTRTSQQVADAPTGFNYSGRVTNTSTGTGNYCIVYQAIEGFNVADFGFGTASAVTFTVTFRVKASIAGTYTLSFYNNVFSSDRAYTTSYTVSQANTWETKTVTVPGDTGGSGFWNTTNGSGLAIAFTLYSSTTTVTQNAWGSSGTGGLVSGSANFIGTAGATFQFTGVQLEVGSTATSFDYRPYGTELALCQRYFESSFNAGTAVANGVSETTAGGASALSTGAIRTPPIRFAVAKRASGSTITFYNATQPASPTANQWSWYNGSSWQSSSSTTVVDSLITTAGFSINMAVSGATTNNAYLFTGNWSASSEL